MAQAKTKTKTATTSRTKNAKSIKDLETKPIKRTKSGTKTKVVSIQSRKVKILNDKLYNDTYESFLVVEEKIDNQIERIDNKIESIMAPLKAQLGIDKLESKKAKLEEKMDKSLEDKDAFFENLLEMLLSKIESKQWRATQNQGPSQPSYKEIALELLGQLYADKNEKDMMSDFEDLKIKHAGKSTLKQKLYHAQDGLVYGRNQKK